MPGAVTELLARWAQGDHAAFDELVPVVYRELRDVAGRVLSHERAGHTLQPTALVNEAYLRLTGLRQASFTDRAHFFGAAANAMRRILVDHARRRDAVKRGDGWQRVSLDDVPVAGFDPVLDLVELDEALDRLAEVAPPAARVVELRCFAGLSVDETAAVTGVSPATVKRQWTFGRAWLHRQLAPLGDAPGRPNA